MDKAMLGRKVLKFSRDPESIPPGRNHEIAVYYDDSSGYHTAQHFEYGPDRNNPSIKDIEPSHSRKLSDTLLVTLQYVKKNRLHLKDERLIWAVEFMSFDNAIYTPSAQMAEDAARSVFSFADTYASMGFDLTGPATSFLRRLGVFSNLRRAKDLEEIKERLMKISGKAYNAGWGNSEHYVSEDTVRKFALIALGQEKYIDYRFLIPASSVSNEPVTAEQLAEHISDGTPRGKRWLEMAVDYARTHPENRNPVKGLRIALE